MRRAIAVLFLSLLASGCTAAMPMDKEDHLAIHWRKDFAAAKTEAAETKRPLLIVCAAGAKSGFC